MAASASGKIGLVCPVQRLSDAAPDGLPAFRRVHSNFQRVRRLHDIPGFGYFIRCAMSQKDELVRLER
jgi:hypothetical protein